MDDRIYWKAGDQLHIQAHKSRPNCGLTYGNKKVIAAEAGCSGGWDVWDSLDGGHFLNSWEVSIVAEKPTRAQFLLLMKDFEVVR